VGYGPNSKVHPSRQQTSRTTVETEVARTLLSDAVFSQQTSFHLFKMEQHHEEIVSTDANSAIYL